MRFFPRIFFCGCLLFSTQLFAEAEQACLISGLSQSGSEVNDCVINTGISDQSELAKFCYEFTELRSSYKRVPEPGITYDPVCPAAEQAECSRPAGKNVQVLFYDRTPAQLSLEQEYCTVLGGVWSLPDQEEEAVTEVSEIYNLCNYLDGKSFASLQRFNLGLSLISYQWKLEFGAGQILWRKSADQTERVRYTCNDGEIQVRSIETGERYQLDASIYSTSVTFEGVAYDQLMSR